MTMWEIPYGNWEVKDIKASADVVGWNKSCFMWVTMYVIATSLMNRILASWMFGSTVRRTWSNRTGLDKSHPSAWYFALQISPFVSPEYGPIASDSAGVSRIMPLLYRIKSGKSISINTVSVAVAKYSNGSGSYPHPKLTTTFLRDVSARNYHQHRTWRFATSSTTFSIAFMRIK
jgi:hypothetical protein